MSYVESGYWQDGYAEQSSAGQTSIISMQVAKEHLRVTNDDEDVTIQIYLDAAERSAAQYLNRTIYANAAALAAGSSAAPAALTAAVAAYDAAIEAADLIEDKNHKRVLKDVAEANYRHAQANFVRAVRGIVITETITAAILLTLGHLFENREENVVGGSVSALPMGVQALLMPDRISMGL